ncbi:MAG: acyl-CoA dehydratase activase [Thermodesulfobacteriota bacterium]|nr:acyl-CoA dehydratase activase [Thermodesulfobacteriota bacterium]
MTIVVGVDVGSLCTKTVVLNGKGDILSYDIMRSGHYYQGAAEESINNALRSAGVNKADVQYTLGTGYGRGAVTEADAEVTEITCHARGATKLFPDVRTVIDIGGQDSKVIGIGDNSRVTNFVMNDKCAAGTGRFLEVMASALNVDIGEMGDLYFASKTKVEVSSMCTVFAESEVISLFAQGHEKADIAAGIADAISRRVVGMVGQVGLKEKVVMSGGVAKNAGVVHSIEDRIEVKIHIPDEPQIIGALGAAIIASERI